MGSLGHVEWILSGKRENRINAIARILTLSGKIDTIPVNSNSLYTAQYLQPVAQQTQQIVNAIFQNNPELAARWTRETNSNTQLVSHTVSNQKILAVTFEVIALVTSGI